MSENPAGAPNWPAGTLDAVALAIHQIRTIRGHNHVLGQTCHYVTVMDEDMAAAALAAAEAVWPHPEVPQ